MGQQRSKGEQKGKAKEEKTLAEKARLESFLEKESKSQDGSVNIICQNIP